MRLKNMRGKPQAQPDFLTVINLNPCVPAEHPLRASKSQVDAVLKKLSPLFDDLYAEDGRASIPPEQLLKARELDEGSFDHSVFAKNYERVLSADVAKLFFAEVYDLSRQEGWTSDDPFTAAGTLIEAWASLKSFVRKDGGDAQKIPTARDEDPGNPTVDFRGEKRCNDTHQSTTDSDRVWYRKANGREAKLSFGAHLLLENRQGLCADFTLHNPIGEPEPVMALRQWDAHAKLHRGVAPKTIGADKNDHQKKFVTGCREREVIPHVACKTRVKVAGLDGRTTRQTSYPTSQRIRKRVEEIIGWIKPVGGLRRSRYRGLERTQAWGYFVAGTYNLLRLARLGAAA